MRGRDSTMKLVAEIPARLGSKRVARKNIRPICGKPMIAYAIEACLGADGIDEVYVNTESELIAETAKKYGAEVYLRPEHLAQDHIVSDEFNFDFLEHIECDALVMVNPVSPLVEATDIEAAIRCYRENDYDTLLSVRDDKLHSFYKGKPLNFSTDGKLPMTQDLEPVRTCVWTISIWRREVFMKSYRENGHAVFSGNLGFISIDPLKALKISEEADFRMAEALIRSGALAAAKPETGG